MSRSHYVPCTKILNFVPKSKDHILLPKIDYVNGQFPMTQYIAKYCDFTVFVI